MASPETRKRKNKNKEKISTTIKKQPMRWSIGDKPNGKDERCAEQKQ